MKEWVASTSRRFGDVVGLSVKGFHRQLDGAYEDRDTNANWNAAGTDLNPNQPFRNVALRDPTTGSVVRLPNVQVIGVQTRWNLQKLFGVPIDLWADVLNMLDADVTGAIEANTTLGEQRYLHPPVRRLRLGLTAWL